MIVSDNSTHELLGGILSVLKRIEQELILVRIGLSSVRGEYPPPETRGPYPPGPPYTNPYTFSASDTGEPGLASAGGVGGGPFPEGSGSEDR